MAHYNTLIDELAEQLNAPLEPDINNVVTILVEEKVKAQLEVDKSGDFFLIGVYVAELPPGNFREKILKDALKANFNAEKNRGILSYLGKHNNLMLHTKLRMENLTAEEIIKQLKHLTNRAKKWQEAMDSGHTSPAEELPLPSSSPSNKNIFEIQ